MKTKNLICNCCLILLLSFLSCNKQITAYKFLGFDNTNKIAYIAIDSSVSEVVWLNTAYYVLDSMNIVLNKQNANLSLQQLGLVTYILTSDNNIDSTIIGSYLYTFETKEQIIEFKGRKK